jgi:DNA polymerase alpha subunit A
MKVTYGFDEPQLPATLKAGRTFSHLFGANTSALELLLLKRKMMGPAWLRIKPASSLKQNISWCKAELQVDNPKDIRVLADGPEAPSLTVMSLALRTVQKNHVHEIVSASGLVFNSGIQYATLCGPTAF